MTKPTEEDRRISLQVMGTCHLDDAARLIADYRVKIQKDLIDGVLLLVQDRGKERANAVK